MLERIQRELRSKGHSYALETIVSYISKGFQGKFCEDHSELASFRQIITELEDEQKKIDDQKIRASFKKMFTWNINVGDDQSVRDDGADETSRLLDAEQEDDQSVDSPAFTSILR